MDSDNGPTLRPGGTVEPANRAAVAKERFQTPPAPAAERFELRDPFAEVTYRTKTFDEMVIKAENLQAIKFHAIDSEGKRTLVAKVNGVWHRESELQQRPTATPKEPAPQLQAGVTQTVDRPQSESIVARIDAEAERAARVAGLEVALTERYVIKRAPIKISDLSLGQTEYRYRGDANRIAFTESTFRLSTDNNNPSVARSMVDVAEARNWQGIRVSGHEDFKRLVWLEASIRGVKTLGYEPQPGDQELLRRKREARAVNRIEPARELTDKGNDSTSKQSARGSGGRKAALAALEAVLIAKRVPEKQRTAVMTAAAENLAQRLQEGQRLKVKVYDKTAPSARTPGVAKPERARSREPVVHVR